jgi:phosphatidylglycerol:prolipoprotein diacylglycerol transferase
MRPRIAELLTNIFHSNSISYLVPKGSTLYVFAILMIVWIFLRRCQISGLSTYHALRAVIWAIVGAIIGAHAYYLLQHLKYVIDQPYLIFNLTRGTASWGAYLGGILCFSIYISKKKLPILSYVDVLGASMGLGPFIGRWSCFLNGCCYGKLSNVPWAVTFPKNTPPYVMHLRAGLIYPDATVSLPVHPVQIYLSLAALIIFFIVSKVWLYNRIKPGLTIAFYWLLYCTIRFGMEFFRGDAHRYNGLSLSQIICLIIIIIAMVGIVRIFSSNKNRKILA